MHLFWRMKRKTVAVRAYSKLQFTAHASADKRLGWHLSAYSHEPRFSLIRNNDSAMEFGTVSSSACRHLSLCLVRTIMLWAHAFVYFGDMQ